jgi:hypothetical protein
VLLNVSREGQSLAPSISATRLVGSRPEAPNALAIIDPMRVHGAVTLLLFCLSAYAIDCSCDKERPETMQLRQCSLCAEADRHDEATGIFLLKDNNPRKPNRWLALPRAHGDEQHELVLLDHKKRTELWIAAIEKARALWGEEWGIAYNGAKVRTQCHAHIHIGKLLKGIETNNFVVVKGPAEIPLTHGEGVWVHPVGKKLHVHLGEQTCETVLLR